MSVVRQVAALPAAQWPAADPFLFCAHHRDAYPAGNPEQGPATGTAGRDIGQDFAAIDGWNMYHGDVVPGFPAHPHQGFETVTVVEEGLVDHTDSAGATARYGQGDTQWLTAGAGVSHCEMFPLVHQDRSNPLHLFQIWLNLPPQTKTAPADFDIFWAEDTPTVERVDEAGRRARVRLVAGTFDGTAAPTPPKASWAGDPANEVAIWHIDLDAGAHLTLPTASAGVGRTLYVYEGTLDIGEATVHQQLAVLAAEEVAELRAGGGPVRALVLQGRPIGAPVFQHGPFVANSREGIVTAYTDYQAGRFGRWTHPRRDPVHPREQGRFALYPDGRRVQPPARV